MLIQDFYKVNQLTQADNKITANITINKSHQVFEGHFPGNPVTPGVCMMQIIKELTEEVTGKSLFMKSASNIKFMAIINPEENPDLELQLDLTETEDGYKVKNSTAFKETMALKLTANFVIKS
jgi:3-hydroxyacyl-[acyl-carrier-protein] dehydratase